MDVQLSNGLLINTKLKRMTSRLLRMIQIIIQTIQSTFLTLLLSIINVSVQTVDLINSLPPLEIIIEYRIETAHGYIHQGLSILDLCVLVAFVQKASCC